jgi:hypothetical protein
VAPWLQFTIVVLWLALPVLAVMVPVTDAWHHSAFYERWTGRKVPRGAGTIVLDLFLLFLLHLPLFALGAALLWPVLGLVGAV